MEVVFGHLVDLAFDCSSFRLDVWDDGLSVADDRLGTTEAGGEGELGGGEFFLENVKGVVVRAGEAVDSLVAITDGDKAATEWNFISGIRFKHSLSNLTTGCIGVLSFVNKHKIKLWEWKIVFQRHPDHVGEVDFVGILG